MSIIRTPFGMLPDGRTVDCFTLSDAGGMEARILTYGGILQSLQVPDRNGKLADVVLGFGSLAPYLDEHPYFGALIGRYANRIARGRFSLNGKTYTLACNNGPNHLHGGIAGFDKKLWDAEAHHTTQGPQLILRYRSADGEEGYPGNLQTSVTYTLASLNELRIDYHATTDDTTVINLTNHAYFNLAGHGSILQHEIYLAADFYLPVDKNLIPLSVSEPVAETPMDLREPIEIGTHFGKPHEQIVRASGGYDHCWMLNKHRADGPAAEVTESASGRRLRVYTTQPGVQFYTGNFLDGTLTGKNGSRYEKYSGFCLETQHFPDSPNHPAFPSTVLEPGEIYQHSTIYQFSLADQ
jgi:aldose 1-epimerase